MTGLHTVADIYCNDYREVLGWKYERAYQETQKYKEGKFILEKSKIIKENWQYPRLDTPNVSLKIKWSLCLFLNVCALVNSRSPWGSILRLHVVASGTFVKHTYSCSSVRIRYSLLLFVMESWLLMCITQQTLKEILKSLPWIKKKTRPARGKPLPRH